MGYETPANPPEPCISGGTGSETNKRASVDMFRAKEAAEKKKLEAEGMKDGEKLVDCALPNRDNPGGPVGGLLRIS